MGEENQSLIEVKRKIALAIRNNYLNSQLPLVEFANRNHIYSLSDLTDIANINVSDHIGNWTKIPITNYLKIADNIGIIINFDVTITRG
jgi:hypothetical protein